LALAPPPVAATREIIEPGGVLLRLYRGAATAAGTMLPALVYFHGGDGGDSAGGNRAAAVGLLARNQGTPSGCATRY